MKCYNVQHNIGKAKYVVNFHDGIKEHKDGSEFFDLRIFSNKVKLKSYIASLRAEGYIGY